MGWAEKKNNPWINSQIIQASKEANGIQQVLAIVEACISDMNLVNLSTSIHRLAKLSVTTPHSDEHLRQSPVTKLLLMGIAQAFSMTGEDGSLPQSLSNITWSLATLRIMDYRVLELAASLAVLNMKDFKAFELASLLWSFAKLCGSEYMTPVVGPLFRAATGRIVACVNGAGFRSLATAAWAFATSRQASQRLFRVISKEVQTCLPTANSQELANIVWAYGTVGHRDEELFSAIAEECMSRLDEFKTQELSNTFWGFASNDFYHEAFFCKALLMATGMNLQPQHVANILWAAARLQRRHPVCKSTALSLLPRSLMNLTSFKPQEVASTAHAVAKIFSQTEAGPAHIIAESGGQLPVQISMFFSGITPWCEERIGSFSDQSLANIVAAFGMLGLPISNSFQNAVEKQVLSRARNLDHSTMVTLLRASVQCPQLRSLESWLALQICRDLPTFQTKELWSLAFTKSVKTGETHHDAEPNVDELRRWLTDLSAGSKLVRPQAHAFPNAQGYGGGGHQQPPQGPRYGGPVDVWENQVAPQLPRAGPEGMSPPGLHGGCLPAGLVPDFFIQSQDWPIYSRQELDAQDYAQYQALGRQPPAPCRHEQALNHNFAQVQGFLPPGPAQQPAPCWSTGAMPSRPSGPPPSRPLDLTVMPGTSPHSGMQEFGGQRHFKEDNDDDLFKFDMPKDIPRKADAPRRFDDGFNFDEGSSADAVLAQLQKDFGTASPLVTPGQSMSANFFRKQPDRSFEVRREEGQGVFNPELQFPDTGFSGTAVFEESSNPRSHSGLPSPSQSLEFNDFRISEEEMALLRQRRQHNEASFSTSKLLGEDSIGFPSEMEFDKFRLQRRQQWNRLNSGRE